MRLNRAIVAAVFMGFLVLLSGCFEKHELAPIVDAWYQKGSASNFYIVRRGDTIYSIAWAFGLDYRALAFANNLSAPYALTVGARLKMTHQRPASESIGYAPTEQASTPSDTQSLVTSVSRWQWPARGKLIHRYSTNPDGHPGISISGQLGEWVRAAASGSVVYSSDGVRGYGNLIIIKHNNSYLSAYAFNQQNLVSVGANVECGQPIARMGRDDAGLTVLYFEIRKNGKPVDPLQLLN